jgi:hypothetical protein
MPGCRKFLLRFISLFVSAVRHCILVVTFVDSIAELKTTPLKEHFGHRKKILIKEPSAHLEALQEELIRLPSPIVGATGYDADQRCFGDDFDSEEAQGRAYDGGAQEPVTGCQM